MCFDRGRAVLACGSAHLESHKAVIKRGVPTQSSAVVATLAADWCCRSNEPRFDWKLEQG